MPLPGHQRLAPSWHDSLTFGPSYHPAAGRPSPRGRSLIRFSSPVTRSTTASPRLTCRDSTPRNSRVITSSAILSTVALMSMFAV